MLFLYLFVTWVNVLCGRSSIYPFSQIKLSVSCCLQIVSCIDGQNGLNKTLVLPGIFLFLQSWKLQGWEWALRSSLGNSRPIFPMCWVFSLQWPLLRGGRSAQAFWKVLLYYRNWKSSPAWVYVCGKWKWIMERRSRNSSTGSPRYVLQTCWSFPLLAMLYPLRKELCFS